MSTIHPILKIQPAYQKQYNRLILTFIHQWDLQNEYCNEITVGPFSTNTNDVKLMWKLIYKPYNQGSWQENAMTLKLLNCESRNSIQIGVDCVFGVHKKMKKYTSEYWVQQDSSEKEIIVYKRKRILDLLYHDSLILKLRIKVVLDIITCNHKVLDDMSKLIKSGDQGDIVFVLGNEEIKAHEVILKVRNETFAKMFECDMIEKKSKRVEIKEMDAIVFKELLHYIYTEKEPTIDKEKIQDLLLAAERYGVDDLKTWCSQEIVKSISVDNIMDIYIFADLINSEFLKDEAVEFVLENNIKINEIDKYKNMLVSYLHLAEEFHVKITERQALYISKLILNEQ